MLCLLMNQHNGFVLQRGFYNSEELWLVIRSTKRYVGKNRYKLSEGDVIRFGRVKYLVKELRVTTEASTQYTSDPILNYEIIKGGLNPPTETTVNESIPLETDRNCVPGIQCKICFSDQSFVQDPLISPCYCSGSMANVHVKCLQRWLSNKIIIKENEFCRSYSLEGLECELCKKKFPESIQSNGRCFRLFDVPVPNESYMILEEVNVSKQGAVMTHILQFSSKKSIMIGRGNHSDVKVNDISVSRKHAFIYITKDGLYLEDNSSKFGTLVQIKRPILLDTSSTLTVQTGRTLLEISLKRNWGWLSCLSLCSNINNVREYSNQQLILEE